MILWLTASAFNKASITDMDLDPEDAAEDGVNTSDGNSSYNE